ncbi:MAG: hypothetical protein ACD_52C00249G0003 [uncultured bacterium]|nr:MAG: hypothetical protein ACD_52C00249G0003 [uncultured bacterium]
MNKVIKRDGGLEDFDYDKITRIAKAAGLEENDAQNVSRKVSEWVSSVGKPVQTVDIRNEVLKHLQEINPNAANLYLWYESTKSNNK